MGKKRNLKENLTDDTLDLSLSELQTVPVKEIAAIPKATCLDLSSNQLTSLGLNFAPSLVHLIKLDLCRNQLTELPENFGLLVNLKHLDLYRNKLQTLPLSFCNLKHLRWLDLKENPLVPKMMQICGPCLDAQGCQFAARNVVKVLGELNREFENEKLKKEAHDKKLHEKELLEQAQKKESKKKKKKKNTAKQVENNREELKENGNTMNAVVTDKKNEKRSSQEELDDIFENDRTVFSYIKTFLKSCLLMLIFAICTFYMFGLYDEGTYNIIISFVKTKSQSYCDCSLCQWLIAYWQQIRTLMTLVLTNIVAFWFMFLKGIIDFYWYIKEDEDVLRLIENTKDNMNIIAIKIAALFHYTYERIITSLNDYFK